MTSRAIPLLLAALAIGCGNYSNEDLEYMNAVPNRDELRVDIPPRSSAITVDEEAELARFTHQVTGGLNALLTAIVNLVDTVRSVSPTSRTSTSRTWGPYPAEKHAGWLARMMIERDPNDPTRFDYQLAFHRAGAADTDWPVLLDGWFMAGQSVRRGTGHFELMTAMLRAEGLDPDLGLLDHMEADYETGADPITIQMMITNMPDPGSTDGVTTAAYHYAAAQDGRHQMAFGFTANIVPGPLVETTSVTSLWLDSGEGLGDLVVQAGEGAGSTESQCWNGLFQPVYSRKAWATPGEDIGMDRSGCPALTPLF
jgi:hypothetical protein